MNQRQLAREKLLFRYTSALERGDFATVEAILNEARHDAELERMLYEINTALGSTVPAVNLHRYNHKDSTMQHNPTLKLTHVRERSLPTRFPYALAAAILAVILVGGLLITAKFGFDNQNGDNFGGASLQRESATIPATVLPSSTPFPANGLPITGTPTSLMEDANPPDLASTGTPTLDPNALDLTATAIPQNYPYYNTQAVLCTAIVTVGPFANQPNPPITLGTRPGNTWIFAGGIPDGTTVDILDQSYFPGGTGVWRQGPLMWYFVSSTDTPFPIQGWLQEFFVEFTSACPPLPAYETDYWLSGIDFRPNATAIQGGLPATLPPQDDPDGDGLTNADEVALGTNPNAWDTDGDDIGDGSEIRSGTNPLNLDTDMDGVVDSQDTSPTDPSQPADIAAFSTAIAATMYAPSPTMLATATPSVTPSPIFTATPNVCNPANPSRLSKGDQGRVIGEGRTGVNLRQNYGFDAPLIRLLDINTEFEVVDLNAICVEGTNWYKIALDGEDAGWIPETMWVLDDGAASSVYVIEPLN